MTCIPAAGAYAAGADAGAAEGCAATTCHAKTGCATKQASENITAPAERSQIFCLTSEARLSMRIDAQNILNTMIEKHISSPLKSARLPDPLFLDFFNHSNGIILVD